uniref:Putative TonB dependent receptor protein n=1 Tax=Magnetococcus massalia (strain MO-1) TaxID=451514 RepID=A0A1S7LIM3_MAGMO|nr:Putative TonB dependent receptor protein [Candidatus Magnetococcus massalia]
MWRVIVQLQKQSKRTHELKVTICTTIFLWSSCMGTASALESPKPAELGDLLQMDLKNLLNVKVFSVSKRDSFIFDSAASTFVISRSDIESMPATTLPDLLGAIPGLDVARYNAHQWAVSIRGNNDLFANKLLVLLDGRPVYSWIMTGTSWYMLDLPVQNIEQIEVVRGPGGTLWGTNAVNGIINILTKKSGDIPESELAVQVASQEMAGLMLRGSGKLGTRSAWSAHLQGRHYGSYDSTTADNGWESLSAGLRLDGITKGQGSWLFQTNLRSGRLDSVAWNPVGENEADFLTADIFYQIEKPLREGVSGSLQFYTDYESRDASSHAEIARIAVNSQLDWQFSDWQDIMVGGGVRWNYSRVPNLGNGFSVDSPIYDYFQFNAFIQDTITVNPSWEITLGSKVELHGNRNPIFQPSIRTLWKVSDSTRWWVSASRASREPSRLSRHMTIEIPGNGYTAKLLPDPDLKPEIITAYETGLRRVIDRDIDFDLSLFINQGEDLITRSTSAAYLSGGSVYVDLQAQSAAEADTHGGELVLNWRPSDSWRSSLGYSYIGGDDLFLGGTPQQTLSAHLGYDSQEKLAADLWLRARAERCGFADPVTISSSECLPSRLNADFKVRYELNPGHLLSLNGRNIFGGSKVEFESNGGDRLVAEDPMTVMLNWQVRF